MFKHCWKGATVRLPSLDFLSSNPEGSLLSLHLAGFWTVFGCSQQLRVSDSWCRKKVEGGDKKPSEGISFFRANHTCQRESSLTERGTSALNLLLFLVHWDINSLLLSCFSCQHVGCILIYINKCLISTCSHLPNLCSFVYCPLLYLSPNSDCSQERTHHLLHLWQHTFI